MKEVAGKVAVVTGAASGIGRGMAESFAAAGMKVVLSDIESEPLSKTCEALRCAGADVHAVVTDVSKPDQVSALAQQALARYGQVHVLCNNAGVTPPRGPTWQRSLEEWHWILGVNLMGVIHGIHSFLPLMIEQGVEAHIVNTASLAGLTYGGNNTLYGVSKFGVVALSEGLHFELALAGLKPKVSVLCPGFVKTNIVQAGRNRPADLAAPAAPSTAPFNRALGEWFTEQIESGLDPRAVGDHVLDAIRSERFYVLTHPEWQPMIEHRNQHVSSGSNPVLKAPPGIEKLTRKLAGMGEGG